MKKKGVLILTKTTCVGSNCLSRFFVSVVPNMASLISIPTMYSVYLRLFAEAVSLSDFASCEMRDQIMHNCLFVEVRRCVSTKRLDLDSPINRFLLNSSSALVFKFLLLYIDSGADG
jgi:hypothetical protein